MFNNLYELILKQSLKNSQKIALVGDREYSYSELHNHILYFAEVLGSIYKIREGNRVGIFLPNLPAYAIAIFALNKIGAISVPINIRLDRETLNFILKDSGIKLIIVNKDLEDKINETHSGIKTIIVEEKGEYFNNKNLPFEIIKKEKKKKPLTKRNDLAIVMYTSGTTGTPKGAMMTNSNLLFNCRSCQTEFELTDGDIHLIVVPLFHVTGLNSQLLASIHMGNTAVLLKKYHTKDVFDLLKKYNVTIFIAVPTVFVLLLAKLKKELKKLKELRAVGYAGAPMPVNTILSLKKCLPKLKCYNFYGLTETSSITTVLPDKYALKTPDSVGVPVKGVKLRIVDKKGKSLKRGEIGELWIKGGNIVKGYFNNKAKTRENITSGWLHSGDMVRLDEENRVFLIGRKKEIINRGGEKIYPITLENKLFNHPKVLEAAVVGVPDKIFGEAVRVCLVKKANIQLTKEEVIEYCKEKFSEYELPRDILFLKELPKNANGKVQKDALIKL